MKNKDIFLKTLVFLTIIFLGLAINAAQADAASYMVYEAGSSAVNGVYAENGTANSKPKYEFINGGTTYVLGYDGSDWVIGGGGMWEMETYYQTTVVGDTPPSTSWTKESEGSEPAPDIVALAGPVLSYSTNVFRESSNDNGAISGSNTITYKLNDTDSFIGANGVFSADKYTVSNAPAGLTAVITKNSATELSVSFTGAATSHANANDISNLQIAFNNSAFTNNNASAVTNATKSNLQVDFTQTHTVCASGCNYTTITLALANAAVDDYDALQLSAEAYTESITINKAISIHGQGANVSTIQANAAYNTATNRVFLVPTNIPYLKLYDLTVKNGVAGEGLDALYYQYAGGICAYSPLYIYNSIIKDNILKFSGVVNLWGGGIYSQDTLYIENSLIQNNETQSAGSHFGGGIHAVLGDITIVNSTISGNTIARGYGAALSFQSVQLNIINSTISENESTDGSSSINYFNIGNYNLKNSIIYGNNSSLLIGINGGIDLPVVNAYNSVLTSLDNINGINSNNLTSNPLLVALTTNGGHTPTYALQAASPAVNAGLTGAGIPTTDQRGYMRDANPDIGSYEYGASMNITTCEDLQDINLDLDTSYSLSNNIDCSATTGWNSGAGFVPVGNASTKFTGSFDGNGHAISHLFINRTSTEDIGLFGYTNGATITDVVLSDIDITGQKYIGALIGYDVSNSHISGITASGEISSAADTGPSFIGGVVGNANGTTIGTSSFAGTVSGVNNVGGLVGTTGSSATISNSSSSGSIIGIGSINLYSIGGLIGANNSGSISASHSSMTVNTPTYNSVGGLVGNNAGAVTNSYATGSVAGTVYVGGLFGYSNGTASGCYATGNAQGTNAVGGLAGKSANTISNSYASGSVTGSGNWAGGLVGDNYGDITNCYSAGTVTGVNYVGGFVGDQEGGTVTNSFWDTETSSQPASDAGTGKTTAQMFTQSIFTDAGWNFTTIWEMFTQNYPKLLAIAADDPTPPPDVISPTLASDVSSGTYTSAQTVTLTCNEYPCNIYYTLDSSTPDNHSTLYSVPLFISATTIIKAIAYDNANNPSSVLALNIVIETEPEPQPEPADTTLPETIIDSHPDETININSASFTFSSNETSTFQCKLDSENYSSCTSPKNYTDLTDGLHTFNVKAIDTALNEDLTPASFIFTVNTAAARIITKADIGDIQNSANGIGIVKLYDTNNNEICTIHAWNEGGAIGHFIKITGQDYIAVVKKHSGTTIHLYDLNCNLVDKDRLSSKLEFRQARVGNFKSKNNAQEIAIGITHSSKIRIKILEFDAQTKHWLVIKEKVFKHVSNTYQLEKNKNNKILVKVESKVLYKWKVDK